MDNNDLIYANFKTDLVQEDFNFPVTLPSLNTIIKDDEIKNKYRIKLATHQPTKVNYKDISLVVVSMSCETLFQN